MLEVRASELDRAVTCPASLYPADDEILIDQERGESAGIGSAVHAVLEHVVEERLAAIPDVEPFAIAADVADEEEEVEILSRIGLKWLNENRAGLSEEPQTEVKIRLAIPFGYPVLYLTMHPDLYDYVEIGGRKILTVVDYKTGRMSDAGKCREQMTTYAYGAMSDWFGDEDDVPVDVEIVVYVLWLRDQEVTTLRFTPRELAEWEKALPDRLEWDRQTYTPGSACYFCPRAAVCPGRRQLLHAGIEVLSDSRELIPYDSKLPADPAAWGRAIVQARLLKPIIDDFLAQSAVAVKVLGGSVPLPDGRHIYLKSRAGSAKLDPLRTLYALFGTAPMTPEDVAGIVTIKKKGVEEFIGAHAPRGEKGKLIEATLARFEEEGILKRGRPAEWVEVREQGG